MRDTELGIQGLVLVCRADSNRSRDFINSTDWEQGRKMAGWVARAEWILDVIESRLM